MTRFPLAALLGVLLAVPALAAPLPDPPFTGAQIDAAQFTGQDLPPGRSPLTAKVQILLDRAGTSPGVTDGFKGAMSTSALKAFERRMGLPIDGVLDAQVWALLQAQADKPATRTYTITAADAEGLVAEIPRDYLLKANMVHLGYTSVAEKLGERFHMDERFLRFLNPNARFVPGEEITVMDPGRPVRGTVTRIIIDKATRRVAGYDDRGRLLVDYPATIGSDATPSPSGHVTVTATALNPEYTYNPKVNFTQGENRQVLKIPPGPNGPVGTVWIALSKPTYGIHGTATPSQLFHNQSFGCVRLTNWDAEELAHMVRAGVTRVEFLEPGTAITDVTEPVAPPKLALTAAGTLAQSARPALRPAARIAAADTIPAPMAEPAPTPVATATPGPDPMLDEIEARLAARLAQAEAARAEAGAEVTAPAAPQGEMSGPQLADAGAAMQDPLAAAIIAATQPEAQSVASDAPAAAVLPALPALHAPRPPRRPASMVN